MGPKTRVVAGIVLTLLAGLVFWATERWLTTRIFEPLRIPISLNAGQFETEFRTNLYAEYSMQIGLDFSEDDWYVDETDRCNEFRLRQVEWRIFRVADSQGEELWAASDPASPLRIFLSEFRAKPGKYRVRLEIPASTTCLNSRHPRLIISTGRYSYDRACGWIELFCFLMGSSGALLALRGILHWLAGLLFPTTEPRIFAEIALRNVTRRVRHRPLEAMASLNNLAVAWIAVLCAIIVIFYWFLIRPYPLYGLAVDFGTQRATVPVDSPWPETLSVYIDAQGRFHLNGKIVESEKLEERLKEELGKRVVWSVYVEADANVNFYEAVYAMDTITGLGGKVIWITPKTRNEWERNAVKADSPLESCGEKRGSSLR